MYSDDTFLGPQSFIVVCKLFLVTWSIVVTVEISGQTNSLHCNVVQFIMRTIRLVHRRPYSFLKDLTLVKISQATAYTLSAI